MQDLSFSRQLTGSASLEVLLKPHYPYVAAGQEESVPGMTLPWGCKTEALNSGNDHKQGRMGEGEMWIRYWKGTMERE